MLTEIIIAATGFALAALAVVLAAVYGSNDSTSAPW